jgi:hypothetical protein
MALRTSVALSRIPGLEKLLLDLEDQKAAVKMPPLVVCQQGTKAILAFLSEVVKGGISARELC